jgi:3-isopropylmalate/(R)-2-methylmalate dehydratase large subunit
MRININGKLNKNVTPKDVILYILSKLGTSGGTGFFVEYSGNVFKKMSMEGRMTVCNMSIEMGARGGIIAPDEVTYKYLMGRKFSPKGDNLKSRIIDWEKLKTENDATFDLEYSFDAIDIFPMLTYGTNPGMGIKFSEKIPRHTNQSDLKALKYMGFKAGETLIGKKINYVFIGSCTNSRIEDFRSVANYINNKKKSPNINALIVPGSQNVLNQIIDEGLDAIFEKSGFEIRQPGCSACLGMNEDKVPPGKLCISTSNRNFEGRQGPGSRTILSSPLMAAAAAIHGKIVDINE